MAFKVIVLLLIALIAWGWWMGYQLNSTRHGERTQETPIQETPAPEPPPPPPTQPILETAEPAPAPLTEARKLDILDHRVRVCIRQQRGLSLPVEIATLTTRKQRTYRNVSVIRLEPDGIHVRHGGGLEKLGLALLPDDVRSRFFIEEDLAVRYQTVIAERQRLAEQAQIRNAKEAAATGTASVLPVPASGRVEGESGYGQADRCDVCGARVPAKQIKVVWNRLPGTTTMGRVKCCPRCIPSSNGVDPYMKR